MRDLDIIVYGMALNLAVQIVIIALAVWLGWI